MIGERRLTQAMEMAEEFSVLDIPLARFLSQYFKAHPKAGSRDRRALSDLMYSYYRCYYLLQGIGFKEKLLFSYFLMGNSDPGLLSMLPSGAGVDPFSLEKDAVNAAPDAGSTSHDAISMPHDAVCIPDDPATTTHDLVCTPHDLVATTHDPARALEKRKSWLARRYPALRFEAVFPWTRLLTGQLDRAKFSSSLLVQPRLFIRPLKGFEEVVAEGFRKQGIEFELLEPACLALDNRTPVKALQETLMKGTFEIQDYSSQRTGPFFGAVPGQRWWDCCAGGGGKSLLLAERYSGVHQWASDSRASVLANLETRFMDSQQVCPKTFVYDLVNDQGPPFQENFFDGILCDAPCTGSGTWSRTPERLGNFHDSSLTRITSLQRSLVDSALRYLKPGGHLVYITCSVFTAENEDQVQYLTERHGLVVETQQYLDGTQVQADSLFVSRMRKIH